MIVDRATEPFEVVAGDASCDHVGCQILYYESPAGEHRVWTCVKCHRVVRHDTPGGGGHWTTPEVLIPKGYEGVLVGCSRVWLMPKAEVRARQARRARPPVGPSRDRKGWLGR